MEKEIIFFFLFFLYFSFFCYVSLLNKVLKHMLGVTLQGYDSKLHWYASSDTCVNKCPLNRAVSVTTNHIYCRYYIIYVFILTC